MANPTTPATGNAQAAEPNATSAQAATSTNAPAATDESSEPMSLEEAKKLRQEAKALRARVKAQEEKDAAAQEAAMGDLEKVTKRATDFEQRYNATIQELRDLRVEIGIKDLASKLGVTDPALAAKLIKSGDVEFNDDGQPENLEKLVRALVAEHSILSLPQQNQPQAPQANQRPAPQSTMNPPRSRTVQAPAAPFDYANRPRLGEIWKKNT